MEDLHIYIYGEIGWEVKPQDIQDQLKNSEQYKNIIVHMSSPGGGVFDGWTIGNILKLTGKNIEVIIEGLCASIATYIALQGNAVKMTETARFMIHNPSTYMEGDQEDLKSAAEQLDKIKNDLVRTYKAKTGISDVELSNMMKNETWMTAQEAKNLGFIDEIVSRPAAVAKFDIPKQEKKTNKMPRDKKKDEEISRLDRVIGKANDLLKNLFKVTNAMTIKLADGTSLYVETEDEVLEGKKVYTIDDTGAPTQVAPVAGDYTLEDGRVITVDDTGTITAVSEAEAAPDQGEEIEALKSEIEALKAQLAASNSEKQEVADKNAELSSVVRETVETVTQLADEVNSIKALHAGEPFVKRKVFNKPKNKFNEPANEESPLKLWANDVLKRRGLG